MSSHGREKGLLLASTAVAAASILTVLTSAPAARATVEAADCPRCAADFAIYNPSEEEDGVWEEEVKALKALFKKYGFTYGTVDASAINRGDLGAGAARRYRALVGPGGWAAYRKADVTSTGDANIRSFVSSGGNYVGFCAGAYWVTRTDVWAQRATGDGGEYNRSSDYKSYAYDVGLLRGDAQGPFGWSPWDNGENPSLQRASIQTGNPTMKQIGLPGTTRFFYGGGPVFVDLDDAPPGYEVWAKAKKPSDTPSEASTGAGKPTIVRFGYGEGTAILFSYHPSILIDSMVDNVELSKYWDEDDVNWKTGSQTQDEINLDSWNIAHAAFQVAANQPVTKLKSLPK